MVQMTQISGKPDSADRERAGDRARTFFDSLWKQGDDSKLETSAFEQARYARLLELLGGQAEP